LGQPWCVVELAPDKGVARRCSGCGALTTAVHDRTLRRIRDLSIFDAAVELRVPRLRLACPSCGPRLEHLDWLDPHTRVTRRLAASVARLCAVTSVRHAAAWHRLDWKTAAAIRAVAMDMNSAFDLEVRAHCPNAEVVYDLFHVVAKYGREVIDRVRVDEANRLRHDAPARRVVKTSRWLLLRNRSSVSAEQTERLDDLLAANQALMTVYVLKDALKDLWRCRHEEDVRQRWQEWLDHAVQSGRAPLQAFARRLAPYLPGIVAHCRWPMGANLVEGINNRIKVIKRIAYGFRDDAYFFLKIRAAFPGVG
jgi:transposase